MFPSTLRQPHPPAFKKVLSILQDIAPLQLGAPWDNIGLLVDSVNTERWEGISKKDVNLNSKPVKIFLCNDLSEKVVEEALNKGTNMIPDLILTYHPTPFGKQNKFKRDNHISRIILSVISNQVPVYSTHTAHDCVRGGLNDWLLQAFCRESGEIDTPASLTDYFEEESIVPCEPNKSDPTLGFGRIGTLKKGISMNQAAVLLKKHLGKQVPTLRRADAQIIGGSQDSSNLIKTIAVCAGSGGSIFKALSPSQKSKIDLVVSGEMSHHDVLELTQNGISVLLAEHSNSERDYLRQVLRGQLKEKVKEGLGLKDGEVEVVVSEVDADPLYMV